MDIVFWAAIGGGAFLLLLAIAYFAPARATVVFDTTASTARADLRLFWGIGPVVSSRALPRTEASERLRFFDEPLRIGHALMTPGIADAVYVAVRDLFDSRPRLARLELGVNLGDPGRSRVVETAVQAAYAGAPAAIRDIIVISQCETPGAELRGRFELNASPARLSSIWSAFRNSRPAREFRRRLRSKPKPEKKPVREVRTS